MRDKQRKTKEREMKRELRRFISVMIMSILVWGSAMTVFAEEADNNVTATGTEVTKDSADNAFAAGDRVKVDGGAFFGYFGAGNDLSISNINTEDAIILAGNNVNLESGTIEGSAYLAGYNVYVADSRIDGNIVSACYELTVDSKSEAHAVIAVGNEIEFYGTTDALTVSAGKVVINGVINGDANVSAAEVEIGPDAVITGKLDVTSEKEPVIADGANLGAVKFEKMEGASEYAIEDESVGHKVLDWIKSLIYWIVAMSIVGAFMYMFMRPQLDNAAYMFINEPVAIFATGAIALIAVPLASIICMITVVGIPFGLIVLTVYSLTLFTAAAFTGVVLGPVVLKNIHRLPASFIGLVVIEVALKIPNFGGLVRGACMIFALGYLIQVIWKARTTKKVEAEDITDVIAEIPMVEENISE